ncbi:carboxypeptidase regulatory-like domain-containing protein [Telmatobacter bradus]|uniref:TonB-dependent receptor n=1 Tax=Telmatobacter bradus TaxID=474953 RepID=UPI003B430A84
MRNRLIAVLSVLVVLCLVCAGHAQSFRGSIQGTVTDSTGAAIPGAEVKITSPGTGLTRTVTTNDLGGYVASELPLGTYNVTVTKEGFGALSLTKIPVSVGTAARADAKLNTGEVKEVVEVIADVPMVETGTNSTGGTIESQEAAELPVNGHDYTKLLELVPGATSDPNGSTESAGSYGLFSLNGNRGRSNNYLLDGTDMNDGYRNLPAVNQAGVWGAPSTILPVDALAEIPVTGSPEPEFGRSAGATVNIVTKSGTNELHGSAFEYFRNDSLASRNYFNTADLAKNSYTNEQFGGLVDGPIFRDRTFFTLSYEGQREQGGLPQLGTVPTVNDISLNTPSTGINPVMANILAAKPWGTLPASNESVTYTTPFHNSSDNMIAKIDQHLNLINSGDLLTGRFFYSHGIQSFPLGMLYTGSSAPGFNTTTPTHVSVASLSYTTVPRSNLIVELRGGYNRFLQQFLPQDRGLNPETKYGLDTLPTGYTSYDLGLPTITIEGGYSPIGATASDSRGRVDTNYQGFGNVSLTQGHHSFKAGIEFRRTFINSFINSGHRGKLYFDSLEDFLAGTPDSSQSSSAEGYGKRYSYQNGGGVYFLDSYHLNAHLTLNYGVRWDYFGVIGAKNNAFTYFNPTTTALETIGAQGAPSSLYQKSYGNVAPRISMVDDVYGNGKLVVRSSVGLFYDGPSQDFFVGNQAYNTNAAQAGPAFNDIQFASLSSYTQANGITAGQAVYGGYAPSSAFTVAQNNVTPRYVSYNLNIESQLAHSVAFELGYVGSQGRHLYRFRDLNQVDNVQGSNYKCANGNSVQYGGQCFSTYTDGSLGTLTLSYLNQIETSALSNYNSLQSTLKIQNWHGLTSTLNYTWAHSIDTASDGMDFVPNAAMPDNSFNPHGERANSNFDVRNRVQWYWSYNFPKARHAQLLASGWAVNGIFNYSSGQPYTVSYLFEGDYNGTGEYFGRPDIIGNLKAGAHGNNLLNYADFAAPCTWDSVAGACVSGTQHPGNEARNQFRSPNFTNFDFSLTKTTHLTHKVAAELRIDAYNILNHPNFCNPLLPGFGIDAFANASASSDKTRLLGGGSTPYLQSTATPDVGSGNPYLGGGGPRSAEVALHLSF